jgi:hypothetical protein
MPAFFGQSAVSPGMILRATRVPPERYCHYCGLSSPGSRPYCANSKAMRSSTFEPTILALRLQQHRQILIGILPKIQDELIRLGGFRGAPLCGQ